ncbi:IS200/IS605 family transposase [Chryseobacterium limigenitum]|uniref:REP element-mobilizing transposase RayT n=1 Tax=Chryseobacterium limigenitum TaxID=1612149 RepID=A0A1K2IFX3_9FLAO|nr:IS200/IS605 family transposase [Chryseobacterium limigenitum]SFZ91313.1 REP element-mobilizing transposase RayT [Chryseobacterium limigenitum]
MANTYIQIYIQFIFAVQGRQNLIHSSKREDLHKYISGIIKYKNQKLLAIYANPDHIHLFVGFNSLNFKISDFMREIKANSSRFINEEKWVNGKFNWQEGYGAFSYSKSQINKVVNYILNQEEHHKKKSFKEEYLDLLNKFEIQYEEKYLFEFYND